MTFNFFKVKKRNTTIPPPAPHTARCRAFVVPVVVRAVLALGGVGCDSADDLLSVGVDQLHRVDGQVLIEVGLALGCVRTQVTLVLPFFCNTTQHTHTHTQSETRTLGYCICSLVDIFEDALCL